MLPVAIFCRRCVVAARGLEVCCVQSLHKKASIDPGSWKVCSNKDIEEKIKNSHITAISVCDPPNTLTKFRFIVALGYHNGMISLAGVDTEGVFNVISHNDKHSEGVNRLYLHLDAANSGLSALHTYVMLQSGTVHHFTWNKLEHTQIDVGNNILGLRTNLYHKMIMYYNSDGMTLKALDTNYVLKTFDNVGTSVWGECPVAFHPLKRLVAFAGSSAVRYTSGPRWDVYEFGKGLVHNEPISFMEFAILGDVVALLTASSDKVAIWDFDSQVVLFSMTSTPFRVCAMTDLSEKEVSLAVIGDLTNQAQWNVKRLSMPKDDRMVDLGAKNTEQPLSQTRKSNKRLRHMVDTEAVDAGDVEEDDNDLFDLTDMLETEVNKEQTPRSESADYHTARRYLDMFNDESSQTLLDDIDRLKRRVAQLESHSQDRYGLTPGACPPPEDEASQWLLYWDDAGQITKQGSGDTITIHVHIYSGPNAGYIQRHDKHNCHTAALSSRALVTGSDIVIGGTTHGLVTFNNLSTNETWERRLKNDSIACVAVADDFVAVLGTGILYIYSIAGSVLGIYHLKGDPVGIAAKGNLLAVITECITNSRATSVYSTRLLWINGLRGLARNSLNRVVDLYDDLLVLPEGRQITWLSISDQLNLWVGDSSGQLISLLPAMASFHKLGGVSLEWVPSLDLGDLMPDSSNDETRKVIKAFPLYVNEQKLCYVRLKDNERYPHSNSPVNFLGYTLRKASLRIECASGAYMPFNQFHTVMTRDPKLKEMSASGIVEDVANIPWQQYDEMRHSLTLQGAQMELLMQLQQTYGFWFRDAERMAQKAATSMRNLELVHDKWLLRTLRKVKGQRQDGNVLYDVLRMIRFQRCLDTAAEILSDQMDNRQRKVMQDAAMLLAGVPSNAPFPVQEPQMTEIQREAKTGDNVATTGPGVNDVSIIRRNLNADVNKPVFNPVSPANPSNNAAKPSLKGFNTVEESSNPSDNWVEQVFK
uniref:WDHD1/CFT4 second beta-propeller domain-containing protein n=1 Tax=Babesia bovis TaxID=5865 RepID=A7AN35_BABBO|eukprot:XP_001611537.1 hypothetical protein [Babesia bovis T2Bo]